MRWESEVKHAELTPVRTWSKRDEGNFGGYSLLTPDQNTLSHHGVPGMKWGVTTKEYIKKGYNTLKRRQAILKQKRKAEAKAQFEEGYHRGQRVASNTHFIKDRVNDVLRRKEGPKERLSDRAVDKGVDYALKKTGLDKTVKKYGLDHYIPMAKDFLKNKKDEKIEEFYESLGTEEGQERLQKFANFMARGTSLLLQGGSGVKRLASEGGRLVRNAVGAKARSVAQKAKSSLKEGYRWLLEEDNARKKETLYKIATSVQQNAENKLAEFLNQKRKK